MTLGDLGTRLPAAMKDSSAESAIAFSLYSSAGKHNRFTEGVLHLALFMLAITVFFFYQRDLA